MGNACELNRQPLRAHFDQYLVDLDGTITCIVAKTAWIFTKNLLGILYHKLSTIMLIKRSTGCFKGHFQIFGILGNYFDKSAEIF